MNKRKQIITDVLLNDDFSNVQESMNTLGFTKLQQYVDYLDGCYSHVTNLEHFREAGYDEKTIAHLVLEAVK